jgi:hypothetical protein
VPLTGERSYIHGADLFDALTAATGAEAEIVLSLTAASDCAIELRDETAGPPSADPCGRFRYASDGTLRRHILLRRPDHPIAARRPLNDEALLAGATFWTHRAAMGATPRDASFMRRASELAVALLMREFPEDYWTIGQIACWRRPPEGAAPAVAIRACLAGRFWKVAVEADGVSVGHVVLARGSPRR